MNKGRSSRFTSGLASLALVAGVVTGFGAVGVIALATAPPAGALTCSVSWTGDAGTTDWNTADNWSPVGVPSGTDVCITSNATVVDSNVSPSENSLDVAQGATLTISGIAGLSLTVNGPTTVEGSLVLGPSGTSFTNMTVTGTGPGLTISSTGSVTEDGTMTMGNNGTVPTVTNDGTLTVGSSGQLVFDGTSPLTNGGTLTDDNTAADSIELGTGGFTVTGGTICGTAPSLNSTPLTFSGTPVAGPDCPAGVAQDVVQARSGTSALTGNIPAGYSIVANANVSTAASLTNDGAFQLAGGALIVGSGTTFTNSGSFDVAATNGDIYAGSASSGAFTTTSSGSFTVEGTLTLGSNGTIPVMTNDGTMTLSSTGVLVFDGTSSLTNGGTLTDDNTAANSIELGTGGFTVTGGTICGTAPSLNSTPLTFSGTPVAGPDCPAGVAQDVVQARSGTSALTGNIPAGYSIVANANVSTAASLTNDGAFQLAGGALIVGSGTTFTNSGSFDVAATNGDIYAGSASSGAFTTTSSGSFTIEGTLTLGSNGTIPVMTNDGTMTLSSTGVLVFDGTSSLTNGGTLTDDNTAADSIELGTGGFTVTGGTICGTAPSLNSTPLTFSGTPAAGANCTSGAQDQIQARSGTSALTGNIPAGYSIVANANVSTAASLTNDGAFQLAGGALIVGSGTTFTNSGSFDVAATNGDIYAGSASSGAFTTTSSGSFTIEGTLTLGSNGTIPVMTNDGTMTLSSTGVLVFDGTSSLTNGGTLTDDNTAADSIELGTGGFTVTGGTICGTAPSLNSTPLTFSGTPVAGPDCPAGVAQDVVQARSGGSTLTGNIPAGYTINDDAQITTSGPLTNDGSLVLAGGTLILSSTGTFTNDGGFDTTSANGNLDATGSQTGATFANGSGGNWTIEGNLSVGSNGTVAALTNSGFLGIAPGAELAVEGTNTFTNTSSGTVAFGIDGANTSSANYGLLSGKTNLQGGTLDPVDDDYTPSSGAEYFVMTGTNTGTFTTVLHNATADYTHSNETGVIGGAPATATTTSVTSTANPAVYGQPLSLTATVTPSPGPTGSVTFYAGSTVIGSQSVSTSNGTTTASIEISSLRVGTDSITAVYSGDAVYNQSTSAAHSQVVNQDGPTVSVDPNPTSVIPGQPDAITVDVTATAPGAGTPTGDVSLTDGGVPIPGCQNLVMGPTGPSQVTCDVTYESIADHTIGATYAGDTDFTGGSGSSPLDVTPAGTTTTLVPSANPGPLGEPITYTATVTVNSPGSGTPTGTVSFTDGGGPIAGCQNLTLPASAPLSVQCQQTYTAVANHSIEATFTSGTVSYQGSSDTITEGLEQLGTTTTIGDSTGSSTYGLPVTFTATVVPDPGGSASPTGTVSFLDNGTTSLGSAMVSTSAGVTTASVTVSNLPAGAHSVQATYNGDQTYEVSSSSTAATVGVAQAGTSVVVSNAANPSVVGQQISLTATVTPDSGTGPTGTVQFYDNGVALGPAETVSGGVATLTSSGLALGTHPITAVYGGDGNFTGSTTGSALDQVVNQAGTTTSLTSSANPGPLGEPITYTATVTVNGPGSGTPSGTVSFTDGGNPVLVCQSISLPATAPFSVQCQQTYTSDVGHTIAASYTSTTTSYQSSISGNLDESLAQATTTTAVSVSTGSTTYGQPVTFTATVTPEAGSSSNPTGSVTFVNNATDPATDLGSAPVSTTAGITKAQLALPYLPAGSYSVTATYGGDTVFTGSSSSSTTPATVTVSKVTAGVAVGSSVTPSVVGQSVTLTATITPPAGAGPSGTVQFYDNGAALGPAETVSGGAATLTTSSLALGTHPITAIYGGDGNFSGATTTGAFDQVVNQAATTTTLASTLNPSVSGQAVTFTATVAVTAPGAATLSGTVTFYDNGTAIGSGPVGSLTPGPGIGAQLTTSSLSVATHPITATYGGNSNLAGSTTASALQQGVTAPSQVGTTTVIENSPSVTTTVSQVPTLVAGVTGGSAPFASGTVTFEQGTTVLGTAPLVEQSDADVAQLPVPQFSSTYAIGSHTITAVYSGDSTHVGSTSAPVTLTVVSPIFEDIDLGEEFVVLNSQTGAVANSFFDGSNSCGCNGQEYLAISPDGTRAYMLDPNTSTSTVHVINTATGAVLTTVSVSGWANDIVASPDGTRVYVGSESYPNNDITIISTATNTIFGTIAVTSPADSLLTAMAINPAGTEMFATLQTSVAVVNLTTERTVADIALSGAEGIAVNPNGSAAYATNGFHGAAAHANTVSVISTASNTITHTYTGFTEPTNLTVNPAGTELYVTSIGGGNGFVTGVNLSSGAETNLTLPSSDGGNDLAVSPNGATLYLTFNSLINNDGVFEINTSNLQIATTLTPLSGYAVDDTIRPFGGAPTPPTLAPMSVTTTSLPGAVKGQYYSTTLAATGGLSPYSWQLTGGTLPGGLTLSPSGTLYGTPTTAGGPVSLTFTASDSNFPVDKASATLPLTIASGSTAAPPCGGAGGADAPGLPAPTGCASGSNTNPSGSATATSTGAFGSIAVTASGTGGVTVGQYGSEPSGGVPFRESGNGFDVSLSQINTFTTVSIRDCALDGATSMYWYNPAANGGSGGWLLVSPAVYTPASRFSPACLTMTLSATSSPPLSDLDGTNFFGVEPSETVSVTVGGSSPYTISGTVIGGAISVNQNALTTTVTGTATLLDSSKQPASVTYDQTCILGACFGTVSVSDPAAGMSFTSPAFVSLGTLTASSANETGLVIQGGQTRPYPVQWSVTETLPSSGS